MLHLFPHQEEGVAWMIAREQSARCPGGLLLDDCGLGKTPQVIATMMRNPQPLTLVVVPVNIVKQWAHQLARWSEFRVLIHHGPRAAHHLQEALAGEGPLVVITTYGMLVARRFEKRQRELRRMGEVAPRWQTGTTPLHRVQWDRIVLDECHVIRNARTTRTRYTLALRGRIHWGLTATPVHNGIQDYDCLLRFLGLDRTAIAQLFAEDEVLQKYLTDKQRDLAYGGQVLHMDTMLITSVDDPYLRHGDISLRRTKDQVFGKRARDPDDSAEPAQKRARPTLPELTVDIVTVGFFTKAEADLYRALSTAIRLQLGPHEVEEQVMFELILRMRQASVNPALLWSGYRRKFDDRFPLNLVPLDPEGPRTPEEQCQAERDMLRAIGVPSKTRALQHLLCEHRHEKAIVFCEFREEMPALQRDLAVVGVSSVLYDGTMSLAKREQVVRAMSWTPDALAEVLPPWLPAEIVTHIGSFVSYDAVLVQINSGNAGLNLQMCSRVYFTSPNWNPCTEVQAVSRSHRCGQEREVRAVKLALLGTIDERILEVQERKRAVMSDILNDPEILHNGTMVGLIHESHELRFLLN